MSVLALHHVQVSCPVGGEEAARRFYGGVLGLSEVPKPEALAARGGCWFRGPHAEVHVGVEEPFQAARKAHPAFLVADIDVVAARVSAAGMPLRWDADFPPYRRFHTTDGHGNRVEVLGAPDDAPTGAV